jgi:3-hydroxyisobutyrate dehydrogenase-like beta-hydroxyacid dehydrogenase
MPSHEDTDHAVTTVIGLGPMGRSLATALVEAGHRTTVWNRTAGRAAALIERGAKEAPTLQAAVTASPLTIICVLDDNAVEAILAAVDGALAGRTLVNLTADTPDRARRLAAWAEKHDVTYLDGAIMTPIETIGGPDAVILYSGPQAAFRVHEATLAQLAGTTTWLGEEPGRAASHEVALLDLFWTAMSGIVHAFALAAQEGVDPATFAEGAKGIADLLPTIIDEFAGHIESGEHPGDASSLTSAAAGMKHVIHAAHARELDASVLEAALAIARSGVEAGDGDQSFSVLTQRLRAS